MAGRAFDAHRPPSPDLLADCVHCGLCLPTCPTYALWGEEMDSPRGRIVLMGAGLEDGSALSGEMVAHFDACLGCMACVTACPSGVRYDELIEATRAQVERRHPRSRADRALRRLLFATLPHPGRLRALLPALALARRLPIPARAPRLRGLAALAPPAAGRRRGRRVPRRTSPRHEARARVGLLQGCVQRVFHPGVNAAAARVLAAEGFAVEAPRRPRCCGALALHAGLEADARARAREAIAALERFDLVAVTSAGCGSAMKGYGRLLADEPAWAERAGRFAAKVRDVSELLAAVEPVAPRHPLPLRVAHHDACHLAHAQGVRAAPRALLEAIPGLELLEPAEWELCCGSAGVWGVLNPEPAAELGRRKAANLLATGAEAIVAANPGCALQIDAALRGLGRPLPVHHPIELLDRSIAGRPHP